MGEAEVSAFFTAAHKFFNFACLSFCFLVEYSPLTKNAADISMHGGIYKVKTAGNVIPSIESRL